MFIPSLTALLNPIIFVGFGIPFLLIYKSDRARIEAFWWGLAYCFAGLGFFAEFFRPSMPHLLVVYLSNCIFLVASGLITHGFACRYRKRWPARLNVVIAVLTLAGLIWCDVVYSDINYRTLIIHLGVMAIFLTSLLAIGLKPARTIDKVLWVFVLLSGLQFGVRAVTVMSMTGFVLTEENYIGSLFMTLMHLFVAGCGVLLAVGLLAAVVIDMVAELKDNSTIDSLSGVRNRYGFDKYSQRLAAKAGLLKKSVVVVICDIDRFKSINDTYGHVFGDKVIAAMGRILRDNVRETDCVGRIGGEEFAVLMYSATADDGALLAGRLREAFASHGFETDHGAVYFTASFGVSVLSAGDALESAIMQADKALYRAKDAGRDRVVVSEPENDSLVA